MNKEEREEAISYIKLYRKLDEDLHNTAPKDSVSYYATDKCLKYWDMAIQALSQEPCDDAISQILQRMWNCRGKHTTSIDKVKMEQIIRDELPSVTHKSGKWILTIEDWNKWTCSKCGYVKRTDIHVNIGWKYCPNCGAKMESEDKE